MTHKVQSIAKTKRPAPKDTVPAPPATGSAPNMLDFLNNDYGNAQRVIQIHGEDLRYCHEMHAYLIWDGSRWQKDGTGQAALRAEPVMLEFHAQAKSALKAVRATVDLDTPGGKEELREAKEVERFARRSLNRGGLANALSEAQRKLTVRPGDLDSCPDLLTFTNGTVDLRTGELRPHRRLDLVTKMVHCDYRPEAKCPEFMNFIDHIMDAVGDPERAARMTSYLQRAFGYSLSGRTIEKAMFLALGKPDSGKTTLLNLFRKLVEEYSAIVQVDHLLAKGNSSNSQSDMADLKGARFVMTSEPERGQKLSHSKLKRTTSGQAPIKTTRKYENSISFDETHKLWVDSNFDLLLTDPDDDAVLNRLHPIRFRISVPKDKQDRELPKKLLAEASGIFAWAVQGSTSWYNGGLDAPPEIIAERDRLRREDHIVRFIEERCLVAPVQRAAARPVYEAYTRWWSDSGLEGQLVTETMFGRRMSNRFEKQHTSTGAVYSGVGLRESAPEKVTG